MKKYTLVLFVFTLFLILLGFNAKSASAYDSGCTGVGPYSITTGQFCGANIASVVTCPTGDLFSTFTGQRCNAWQGNSLGNFNQQFQIGARGPEVVAFQQMLMDAGFSPGPIDGIYGPMTDRAATKYYRVYPISPIVPPTPCPLVMDASGIIHHVCPVSTLPPVISGVSGPQSLSVNQQGTWTVTAYDPSGGSLNYSVVWGDEIYMMGSSVNGVPASAATQQTATFTHAYSTARTYTPYFYVTTNNGNGKTAQTSLSVSVGGVINSQNPTISYLSPNFGVVGTQVTIYGSGFGNSNCNQFACTNLYSTNTVHFGSGTIPNVYSSNGTSLTFTVPSSLDPACRFSQPVCAMLSRLTTPGNYDISVSNGNNLSNSVTYTVTSSNSTQCEYANPPPGYHWEGTQPYPICGGYLVQDSINSSPNISSLSPTYGRVGTSVTLTGTGFTATGNLIKFGNLGSENNPSYNLNSNGTSLTFTVPSSNYFACWNLSPSCSIAATMTQPGVYAVSVINANGTSTALNFTVIN